MQYLLLNTSLVVGYTLLSIIEVCIIYVGSIPKERKYSSV